MATAEEKAKFKEILQSLTDEEKVELGLKASESIQASTEAGQKRIQQLKEEAELQKKIFDAQGDIQRSNRASLEIQNQLIAQLNLQERAITDITQLNEADKKILEEIKNLTGETAASIDDLNKLQEDNNRKIKISNKGSGKSITRACRS